MEQATGYFYTHVDCPHCDAPLEFESDVRGEQVTCGECSEEFEVT